MVPKLAKLDIAIEYACNLACKGCVAFSNYNRQGTVTPTQAEEWFKLWHNKVDAEEIALFGGEPLLNQNIGELLHLVRKYWPHTRIKVNSNIFKIEPVHIQHLFDVGNSVLQATFHFASGPLRNQLKTKLLNSIKQFGTWKKQNEEDIFGPDLDHVSFMLLQNKDVFVRCVQYGHFKSPAKGEGKNLRPWNSKNPEKSIEICGNPADPIMYEGRLYKCSPSANLRDTLEFHKIDTLDEWQPYLKYKGVGPNDDIVKFAQQVGKAESICSMCADTYDGLLKYDHLKEGAVEFKNAAN